MIETPKSYHGKHLLTVFFASILFATLGMSMNQVFAMGDAPSTCPNRYDGPIVSFIINNGSNTFDPIANPGVTFNVNTASSYDVTFVIHTSNMSSQNNTSPGTTWYHDDVFAFADGHCVPDSKITTLLPNQDVTLNRTLTNPHPGYYSQSVYFSTFSTLSNPVTYNVQWIDSSSAPQNLQAMAVSSSKINLSWSAPANNGGSEITGYQIERSTDTGSTWSTIDANTGSTSTAYSDTGLNPNTSYTYRVSAINSVGTSSPSNTVSATTPSDVTVPSSPTELAAETISSSQIDLSWAAPANDGGSTITGYDVERSLDNGNTWYIVVSNTGSDDTAYNDTGLSQGTNYTYRVSAINSVGTSSPSNTASATTDTSTSGIVLNNVQSTSGSTTLSSNQITLSDFDAGTGNNRLLVVGVNADQSDVNSITFGGIPLTKKVGSFYNNDAEFWYLKNPTGNGAIVVTMNGQTSAVVGAYSFSGVNQTNPMPTKAVRHNVNPNSPTISLTTKFANDWVLDLPSIYGDSTLSSPTCLQQWNSNVQYNSTNAITGASSSALVPTTGSVTCKWTASTAEFWDDVAVDIHAVSLQASTGILEPLYLFPYDTTNCPIPQFPNNFCWQPVITAHQAHPNVPFFAIVNPNNGPCPTGSGNTCTYSRDYSNGIGNLTNAGVIVLGYVFTGYGNPHYDNNIHCCPYSTPQGNVTEWATMYGPQNATFASKGVKGIFFDGMSNNATTSANFTYYQNLTSWAKNVKGFTYTIGNPGTSTDQGYVNSGAADNLVINETLVDPNHQFPIISDLQADTFTNSGIDNGYDKHDFSLLVWNETTANGGLPNSVTLGNRSNYVGFMYVTDNPGCGGTYPCDLNNANPWNTTSTYLSTLAAELDNKTAMITINSTGPLSPVGGLLVQISQKGNLVPSGYTPYSYLGTQGVTYTFTPQNSTSCTFDHWKDTGVGPAARTVTVTSSSKAYTAVYTGTSCK